MKSTPSYNYRFILVINHIILNIFHRDKKISQSNTALVNMPITYNFQINYIFEDIFKTSMLLEFQSQDQTVCSPIDIIAQICCLSQNNK